MPPKADVRRLLKKQQQERNKTTKVAHPFAKYDQANRLMCVVCNSHVKSEAVWQAHLGSQVHRDNIQKLKELKQQQQQQQQQQQLKRRAPSPPPPTSSAPSSDSKRMRLDEDQDRQDIELNQDESDEEEQEDQEMGLPADFFDKQEEQDIPEEVEETPAANDKHDSKSLPSGFFDDPEEEARVQGTLAPEEQAKADLERDAEMFNEAMMDVTEESKQAQEEDDETFWEERHLDITREQAKFDSRVEKLKQLRQTGQTKMEIDQQHMEEEMDDNDIKIGLKTSVRQVLKSKPTKQVESMFDDDDESDEEDEQDWRAQQL